MHMATIYGSLILCQAVTVFTFIYLAGVLGERIQYDLRKMMFNHLQDLSLSYYAQNAVGRLIARVTSDTGRVADLMTWGVVDTHLGVHEHHHFPDLHGDHQLAAGADRVGHHPDHDGHRGSIPQEDPGGVPQQPPRQLARSPARTTRTFRACAWSRRWDAKTRT